jgi:3-methyladenine DNA glycosylase/8-oxoguanine DNA glycosylase
VGLSGSTAGAGPALFTLPVPAGLRVADVLAYHGRDGQSVSERVEGGRLHKAFLWGAQPSVISLEFKNAELQITLTGATGAEALAMARIIAARLLGLHCDPAPFEAAHPELARGREGLRVLLTLDPFEALVWAILGQQVNLAFAYALRRDLIRRAGVPAAGGLVAHPDPSRVAALSVKELQGLRFSQRKAEYMLHAAEAVASGALRLEGRASADEVARDLMALRGCGPWTAQYVLMRGLGFLDCVPVGDAGLTLALQRWFQLETRPDGPETQRLMAAFAPHRSLATFHFWSSLKGAPE